MSHAQVGQAGTVRNGQHGVITEVFTNGALFTADNGVRYTVIDGEFIADELPFAERKRAVAQQHSMFNHLRPGGFIYSQKSVNGRITEIALLNLPRPVLQ